MEPILTIGTVVWTNGIVGLRATFDYLGMSRVPNYQIL